MTRLLFTLAVLFLSNLFVYTQITIGSDIRPESGALLQLKENGNLKENSKRGLGMPRVSLTNLTPKTDVELAASIGGTGSYSMEEHVGLVVYNVNGTPAVIDPCTTDLPISPGLYVWHGDRWELMMFGGASGQTGSSGGVQVFQDQEGQDFLAQTFGDAGTWMVQNLAVKQYADGTPIVLHDGLNVNPPTDAMYAFPAEDGPNKWKTQPAGWTRKQGLLYNWRAASGNYSPASKDQKQSTATDSDPGGDEVEKDTNLAVKDSKGNYIVQGICPQGWHLPSDREWNELEREVYNNAHKYSYYTEDERNSFSPIQWDDDWATTSDHWNVHRGSTNSKGHGAAMIGRCLMPDVQTQNTYEGESMPAPYGGFDIVLTGYVRDQNASTYGKMEQNWTSSTYYSSSAYVRVFGDPDAGNTTNYIGVRRFPTDRNYLHPVRCKKNE